MDFILRMLMGPWTTYILYNLKTHGPQRFGELKRRVAGISAKMLTERLRTLEGAALVRRDYEATIPPKVTYSLTQRGHELDDVLGKLAEIGMRWEAEDAARRALRATELKAAEDRSASLSFRHVEVALHEAEVDERLGIGVARRPGRSLARTPPAYRCRRRRAVPSGSMKGRPAATSAGGCFSAVRQDADHLVVVRARAPTCRSRACRRPRGRPPRRGDSRR